MLFKFASSARQTYYEVEGGTRKHLGAVQNQAPPSPPPTPLLTYTKLTAS